jgi:GntR family transcriptional regulator
MNDLAPPELILEGGRPIYLQIEAQLRDLIVTGQLRPGEQLPTVRTVAVELGVNPCNVSKAYQELEREGFLSSEEGSGTYVAFSPVLQEASDFFFRNRLDPEECQTSMEELCHAFLAQAARLGYSSEAALKAIETFTHRSVSS